MSTIQTLNPLIESLEKIRSSYEPFSDVSTVWTSALKQQRALIENGVKVSDTDQALQPAFLKTLSFAAATLLATRGGVGTHAPISENPTWVEDLLPVLNHLLDQGSTFEFKAKEGSYRSAEEALVALAELSVFKSFQSLLNTQQLHTALKHQGSTWVRSGRVELLEFAVEMGYTWPDAEMFEVTDSATLKWFLEKGYSPDVKDKQGKTLREAWASRSHGHTQKEVGALTKTLSSYEVKDEAQVQRELFKSMWGMARSVLKREAKVANLDLDNPKHSQAVWSALFEAENQYNLGVASIEVAVNLTPEPSARNTQGVLFSALAVMQPCHLDDKKAPGLIAELECMKKDWEALPEQTQLEEWSLLAQQGWGNKRRMSTDVIRRFGLLASKIDNTPENQIRFLAIASEIAKNTYYVSNLLEVQQASGYGYSINKSTLKESPLRRRLVDIFLESSDEVLIESKELIQTIVFEYLNRTVNYSRDKDYMNLCVKDLLTPGDKGISVLERLSSLNLLKRSKLTNEMEETWKARFPDYAAQLERYFLNQVVPETDATPSPSPFKKRL